MHIGLVLAFLMSASAVNEAEAVRLRLVASKTKLVVGEPLKLTLIWTATKDTSVATRQATILVDDGSGFRSHVEASLGTASVVDVPEALRAGDERRTSYVLAVAAGPAITDHRLAFGRPGDYRLRAKWGPITSNDLTVSFALPTGVDAEMLGIMRARPALLSEEWAFIEPADAAYVTKLVKDHPTSAILGRQRLLSWKHEVQRAIVEDQKEQLPLGHGKAAQVLDRMERESFGQSPFEEDRLLYAAETRALVGDRKRARELFQDLSRKHPDGFPGAKARKWIADEDAAARAEAEPGDEATWDVGAKYKVNDLVTHDGSTWRCIQAHRSQSDWAPPRVPALWVKVAQTSEWSYPVQYAAGTEVTYQGATYTCRQAHTSQTGWTPSATPALWSRK